MDCKAEATKFELNWWAQLPKLRRDTGAEWRQRESQASGDRAMNDRAIETKAWSRDAVSWARQPLASWIGIVALVVLALLGAALRLRQYLFNRSLWVDEVKVALNVIDRNVGELMTVPLAYSQSAPPGFLVSARATVVAFGSSELALRLTPLIAGVLTLLVAVVLARRELKSTAAQATFVGLIALSPGPYLLLERAEAVFLRCPICHRHLGRGRISDDAIWHMAPRGGGLCRNRLFVACRLRGRSRRVADLLRSHSLRAVAAGLHGRDCLDLSSDAPRRLLAPGGREPKH